jgi:hypothetical protein
MPIMRKLRSVADMLYVYKTKWAACEDFLIYYMYSMTYSLHDVTLPDMLYVCNGLFVTGLYTIRYSICIQNLVFRVASSHTCVCLLHRK